MVYLKQNKQCSIEYPELPSKELFIIFKKCYIIKKNEEFTMSKFLDRFDKKTKDIANNFISEIRENKIKKIVRPNTSNDFNVEKAYEAFNFISQSGLVENIINQSYKK